MPERKTVGQLMEEMRLKAGAQNYHGHEYMDLERFAEDTRHMIIFDVLTHDSPVGWKGERTRLFLTEAGYQKSLENQEKGHIKILSHAKVRQGHLYYDRSDQLLHRLLAVGNHGGIPAFLLLQLLFLAVGKVLGDGGLKQPPGKLCSADYQRQSPVFHFLLHRSSPPFHGFCRGGA